MKALLCLLCADVVTPHREWRTNPAWRWCEGGHAATRWTDGDRGLIEVTATHGADYIRVLGLSNTMIEATIGLRNAGLTDEEWRDLHTRSTDDVAPHYLFHKEKRGCWALIVRVGESGDVTFVPAGDVPRPAAATP